MMDVEWIQQQVRDQSYLWTLHADEERRNGALEVDDIERALLNGKNFRRVPSRFKRKVMHCIWEIGTNPYTCCMW